MSILFIAGRELRAIFATTVGWLVLAGFLFVTGIFWNWALTGYLSSQDYAGYSGEQVTLNEYLLAGYFQNTAVILLMMTPAISMRLFSDELRNGTIELLLTSPVSTLEIVIGKFLGAIGFICVALLGTSYVPIILYSATTPDAGALIGGYAVLLLMSSCIVAMGMLVSAMTNNTLIALIVPFAGALFLYLLSQFAGADTYIGQFGLMPHIESLLKGAPKVSDLTFYLSFIGFFLFATHQRVEAYRWR
jgi:ABC-2 type transport system permease protein